MQFVVPQFIDVENKVLGPLSVRQFVIMLIAAGVIFILNRLLGFFNFVFATIFVILLAFVFAFIKINGRGFHFFLLSLFQTYRRPQLKVWAKDVERYNLRREVPALKKGAYVPMEKGPLTSSRLTQLALVVDTGGAFHYEEEEEGKTPQIKDSITPLEI